MLGVAGISTPLWKSNVYTVDQPLILDPDSQEPVDQWGDVPELAVLLGLSVSVGSEIQRVKVKIQVKTRSGLTVQVRSTGGRVRTFRLLIVSTQICKR